MHIFVKSFLAATTVGFFLITSSVNAATKPVDKNDPVVKCQEACGTSKNNESYESCMLQCKKTHKKSEKESKDKK